MKKIILLLAIGASLTTQTLFAQVPSYVPTNGLVGYWPFNGNANDESGNGNNGTVNGATLTTDRFGNSDRAYSFDGVDDFIQVQTPSLSNAITISFWAFDEGGYPNSYSLNPRYVSSEFCNGGFALVNNVNTPGGIFFTRNRGNTSTEMFASLSPTYQINQYITFTYDGINGKFYLNGNLINTVANSGSISQSANMFFGKSGCVFGQTIDAFKGKLDEIGVWNRALTQQEITNLYNSSLPQTACLPANVPTTGLVGYWPFCGNANDESGNGNNGTVNGATLTTDRFGNSNSAYNFDGNNIITANAIIFSNLTISVWYNINNSSVLNPTTGHPPTGAQLIGQGTQLSPTAYCDYSIGITSWNNINQFAFEKSINSSPLFEMFYSNANISYSNWVNLIYTIDSNIVKVYLNSILIDTFNTPTNFIQSGNVLSFGARYVQNRTPPTCNYFTGKLDDIGIWNRALTQEEITNLYNANQCITNITVTDTLIINVGQLSFNDPVTWANNITIAPNPASTQININFNNITNLNGGTLKIINSLGQEVATTPITTSGTNSTMQLATWGGTGMYFVQIINPQGQIVDIKKIILQ
jgi:hypothetical protein